MASDNSTIDNLDSARPSAAFSRPSQALLLGSHPMQQSSSSPNRSAEPFSATNSETGLHSYIPARNYRRIHSLRPNAPDNPSVGTSGLSVLQTEPPVGVRQPQKWKDRLENRRANANAARTILAQAQAEKNAAQVAAYSATPEHQVFELSPSMQTLDTAGTGSNSGDQLSASDLDSEHKISRLSLSERESPHSATSGNSDLPNEPALVADVVSGTATDGHSASEAPAPSSPLPRVAHQLYEYPTYQSSPYFSPNHEEWIIADTLVFVAFLHTRHHVSFAACNLLLFFIALLFRTFRVSPVHPQPSSAHQPLTVPLTLHTVLARLGMEDRFMKLVICSQCHCSSPLISSGSLDREQPCLCENPLYQGVTQSPFLVAPIYSLSHAIWEVVACPGMVEELNAWRERQGHGSGEDMGTIQDGRVWNDIVAADGTPFFQERTEDGRKVLSIGVSMYFDWFNKSTSSYAPSHSSGVLSFGIQNLTIDKQYRVENMILSMMTPGPTEPTGEQMQQYLKVVIDDLQLLYEDGIMVNIDGAEDVYVEVALVSINCDHPAMCKICGCADHRHKKVPCHKCSATHDKIHSDKALNNEFPARTAEQHRQLAYQYRDLPTNEQEAFFKEHGVRWTEVARLKYFDIIRWTIIDPMHNVILGMAKTQWYTQWIKCGAFRKEELTILHQFMEMFEAPVWAGQIPRRIGEPAGGNLTADEYKFATTIPWVIAIPLLWDNRQKEAEEEFNLATVKYSKDLIAYHCKLQQWESQQTETSRSKKQKPNPPKGPPVLRMHEDEAKNFLRFATFLKIVTGSVINIHKGIPRVKTLLHDYLQGYKSIYGADAMKPNHHWALHLPDQLLDFGPVYSFWTFISERLNKTLKNLNSSSLSGGEREVSMMREFHRSSYIDALMRDVLERHHQDGDIDHPTKHLFERMLWGSATNKQGQGLVQDLANCQSPTSSVLLREVPGPVKPGRTLLRDLPPHIRNDLTLFYNRQKQFHPSKRYPTVCLALQYDHPDPSSVYLSDSIRLHEYALRDGRRITASALSRNQDSVFNSSLIQAKVVDDLYCEEVQGGIVQHIFSHRQDGFGDSGSWRLFAEVSWMKISNYTPLDEENNHWPDFPELGVDTFQLDYYYNPMDPDPQNRGPSTVIPFSNIICQLSRATVKGMEPEMWVTTSMDRFPIPLDSSAAFAESNQE